MTVVGFAGMTHLGLVSSSGIASKGFRTICYDGDAALVERLQNGDLPVLELGLNELVKKCGDQQVFVNDLYSLSECDVVYIAPDIPTDDEGRSNIAVISALINQVTPVLKPDAVMVVLSQVEPGFTRALSAPDPVRRYYQVETLVFGIAVERTLEPERYIVGCADPAKPLPEHFATILGAFGCPILQMRYESAELAKISINFCLVSSISVANTLSEVCEKIGADWSEITPALRLDRRIGRYSYLEPGLGIAGGNLERDLATIQRIGAANGTDTQVVAAWKANSRHRRDWAAKTIRAELLDASPHATVAVWGLAYKENTHSVKNSPSLATLRQIPHAHLRLHDPVVRSGAVGHDHAQSCASPIDAVTGADALMILTPWPAYRQIAPAEIVAAMTGRLVLDPYRVLDPQSALDVGLFYHTLGRPPASIA